MANSLPVEIDTYAAGPGGLTAAQAGCSAVGSYTEGEEYLWIDGKTQKGYRTDTVATAQGMPASGWVLASLNIVWRRTYEGGSSYEFSTQAPGQAYSVRYEPPTGTFITVPVKVYAAFNYVGSEDETESASASGDVPVEPTRVTVVAQSDGTGKGTASGGGSQTGPPGTTYTFQIHAAPTDAERYRFVKWTGSNGTEYYTPDATVAAQTPAAGAVTIVFTAHFEDVLPPEKTTVKVEVSASPAGYGTVTGGDTRTDYPGTNKTFFLHAEPTDPTRYKFVKWVGSNGAVYTIADVSVMHPTPASGTETVSYVAYFEQTAPSVSVKAEMSPSVSYWRVSPSDRERRYKNGDNTVEDFQVFAWAQGEEPSDPTEQYRFDHWEITSGSEYATISDPNNPTAIVRVEYGPGGTDRDVTVQAVLLSNKPYAVQISAVAGNPAMGDVSGGLYRIDAVEGVKYCTQLSATPKAGYRFTGWSSDKGGSAPSASFNACLTCSSDENQNSVTWTAHFEPDPDAPIIPEFTGSVGGGGSGSESGSGEPPPEWSGTTERSAVRVTVTCDETKGTATVGGGASDLRTGYVGQTRTLSLEAKPKAASGSPACPLYKFAGWYENGTLLSEDAVHFIEHVLQPGYSEESPEERTIEARFELAGPVIHLVASVSPDAGEWSVSPSEKWFAKTGDCKDRTNEAELLVASMNAGASIYKFDRWSVSGAGASLTGTTNPATTVSMQYPEGAEIRTVEVTAVLKEKRKVCVTFKASAGAGGSVSGGGKECGREGDRICSPNPLVATPDEGYRFVGWTGPSPSDDDSFTPCVLASAAGVPGDGDVEIERTWTANFEALPETSSGGESEGGSGGGSGGTPPPGSEGGSEGGSGEGSGTSGSGGETTEEEYVYIEITAKIADDSPCGGAVSNAGGSWYLLRGDEVYFVSEAFPEAGCTVVEWVDNDGVVRSTGPRVEITVPADRDREITLTAILASSTEPETSTADQTESGGESYVEFKTETVGPGKGATSPSWDRKRGEPGTDVTFTTTAYPNPGSKFQEWRDEGGNVISQEPTLTVSVTVADEPQTVTYTAVMAIVGPLLYGNDGSLLYGAGCAGPVYADKVVKMDG